MQQRSSYSRNIAVVTPKIIYSYHLKIHFLDQSIRKDIQFNFEKSCTGVQATLPCKAAPVEEGEGLPKAPPMGKPSNSTKPPTQPPAEGSEGSVPPSTSLPPSTDGEPSPTFSPPPTSTPPPTISALLALQLQCCSPPVLLFPKPSKMLWDT